MVSLKKTTKCAYNLQNANIPWFKIMNKFKYILTVINIIT